MAIWKYARTPYSRRTRSTNGAARTLAFYRISYSFGDNLTSENLASSLKNAFLIALSNNELFVNKLEDLDLFSTLSNGYIDPDILDKMLGIERNDAVF